MEKMYSYVESYDRTQYEGIALEFSEVNYVQAKYIHAVDPACQGNRLVEALPPMRTWEQCNDDFTKVPPWTPDIRGKGKMERHQMADHLSDFRIVREVVSEIDTEIYSAIVRCYKERIPYDFPGGSMEAVGFYKATRKAVPGTLILGESGAGKTTAVLHALSYLPQLIIHEMKNARMYQIPYLNVSCSPDGSVKNFLDICIEELEKITGDFSLHRTKSTADEKTKLFRNLALRFNVGVIVVDEIQNLLKAKNKIILNHFLMLSNDLSIPFVFVGTRNVYQFLKGCEFFTQRRLGREIQVERFLYGSLWEDFLQKLWKYQWTREVIPLSVEMERVFYEVSGGIIDRVVTLYLIAQKKAILLECDLPEYFTPAFVRDIAETDFSLSSGELQILAKEGAGTTKQIPCDLRYGRLVDSMIIEEENPHMKQKKTKKKEEEKIRLESIKIAMIENVRILTDNQIPISKIEGVFHKIKKVQNILEMSEEELLKEMMKRLILDIEEFAQKESQRNIKKEKRKKEILRKEDFPVLQAEGI